MLKSRKIIVLLVILLLVVGISGQVKATNTLDLGNMLNSNTTTNTVTNVVVNTTTNTTGNEIVQPDTNNTEEAEQDLPQTGVTEDITIMFFIIVCAIVAIYAYKKIRDYKS